LKKIKKAPTEVSAKKRSSVVAKQTFSHQKHAEMSVHFYQNRKYTLLV
jgi:hypothetical protein